MLITAIQFIYSALVTIVPRRRPNIGKTNVFLIDRLSHDVKASFEPLGIYPHGDWCC